MKKKVILFVLSIIIISVFITGCEKNKILQGKIEGQGIQENNYKTLIVDDYNNVTEDKVNEYNINVLFNPREKSYTAKQKVKYINNENVDLENIYFHIYPNTFEHKETAPFLFDNMDSVYLDGFEPGFIDIKKLTVNGKSVEYTIFGRGNTILKLPLQDYLEPEDEVEIYIEYKVVMPPAQERFGYGEKTFNFGNWYPIVAVYDHQGWNLDPYYKIGDPFYSDVNNYNLSITVPKDFIIACSGNILSEEIKGDKKTCNIEAKLMRDFAWVASKHFKVTSKEVDGTLVKTYFLRDNNGINDFALDVSCDAVRIYNKVFGKYPYGQYSVVATSFPSGMEYPGIVFIGDKYYQDSYKNYLETVIVHETGHQWWYGVIGNDEIDEAWLDESLTVYSEVIYVDEKYGEKLSEKYYKQETEFGYKTSKSMLNGTERILKPLNQFNSWTDYGALVYSKGAMLIHKIEEEYGEQVLYKILSTYYDRYRFKIATTEDFVNICEEVTGDDFNTMVYGWLNGE